MSRQQVGAALVQSVQIHKVTAERALIRVGARPARWIWLDDLRLATARVGDEELRTICAGLLALTNHLPVEV